MADRLFPTLTPAQIARVEAHGRRRAASAGEVLIEPGAKNVPWFVVVSGALDVVRPSGGVDTLITTHHAGQFSGEATMITGRPSLSRVRVKDAGEVVEVEREQVLRLIQNDPELSEILMRAFILRRSEMIAGDYGGETWVNRSIVAGTVSEKSRLKSRLNKH